MQTLIINIVIKLLKQYLTKELVDKLKDELVAYLAELAKSTDNQLDDAIVKIVADAIKP